MKIKILLGIYVFILAVIVLLADLNGTRHLLDFVVDIPYGDKIGHFTLTGLFALLLDLAFDLRRARIGVFSLPLGSLIVAIIATLEECSQIYVGRNLDGSDLIADYLGIFAFGILAALIHRNGETEN